MKGERNSSERGGSPVLDLYVEAATGGVCMGHIPTLPGFCFLSESTEKIDPRALEDLTEYGKWLEERELTDLTATARGLVEILSTNGAGAIALRERERIVGAPVWESGNAAALFSVDHRVLADKDVRAHLRFVAEVLTHIRSVVELLTEDQRVRCPAPGRRSLDETLEHIGNCIWWYASRIDDALPEPPDVEHEDPLDRIDRFAVFATDYLLSVPFSERKRVHTPKRFLTKDPNEQWTHAKVCRREAEHAWAHLLSILRDVRTVRSADG